MILQREKSILKTAIQKNVHGLEIALWQETRLAGACYGKELFSLAEKKKTHFKPTYLVDPI